jgi:amino acid adenylation domain-containing protein
MKTLLEQIGNLSPERIRQLAKAVGSRKAKASGPALRRHAGQTEYPLSFGQERMWFLDQLAPGNPAYNWPFAVTVPEIDPDLFRRMMQEIARRHEILRTVYPASGNSAIQRVLPPGDIPLNVVDLRGAAASTAEAEALQIIRDDARVSFDLSSGPLYRYLLIQLGPGRWIFGGTFHHSLADAWSRRVLMEEMGTIWAALATGRALVLPPLGLQYGDFAIWQRESIEGERGRQLLSFWKKQLQDLSPLELATDHPRPAVMTYSGNTEAVSIDGPLTEALRAVGRGEGATLFMTLFAAFQVLMMRYSGQTDIAGAVPVGSRDRTELERLIGFFVNTLILRVDLSGNPTFRELVRRVRSVAHDAFAHQDMPFERLVDELQPKRDMSRTPFAQFIFQVEDIPKSRGAAPSAAAQSAAKPLEVDAGTAIFDFHVHLYEAWDTGMIERPDGVSGTFVYNADLFEPATMRRMLGHFHNLLESIAANADRPIWSFPLHLDAEAGELTNWNRTGTNFAGPRTVVAAFEQAARNAPETAAVVCCGQSLTYSDLDRRANQLAHYLRRLGIGPDGLSAICMDRSLEMIIGMLGVLKAGGAYVPLDPEYPAERLRLMLADSRAQVLLTQQSLLQRFSTDQMPQSICLDTGWERIASESTAPPAIQPEPENLAYCIYTSGSTGKPKAVAIEHRQIVNYLQAVSERIGLTAGHSFAFVSTFAADLGNTMLYPALCLGGTLHVIPRDLSTKPADLAAYFERNRIDYVKITPSHFASLMVDEPDRRLIPNRALVFGGESLSRTWVDSLRQLKSGTAFFNHYGPTETTVGALAGPAESTSLNSSAVPVGKPLANLQAYLLDPEFAQVPVGVPGELCIGGAGVGRGYLYCPGATAERFVADPFGCEAGGRMYRTGDRARRLPDGSIEFLGRFDEQVKIHGYRIEPGEIESAIKSLHGVEDAAVIVRDEESGKRLVACLVPSACGDDEAASEERVTEWRSLYEDLYRQPAGTEATFNAVGWNSSYTGLPIPDEDMRESVDRTVERVLSLGPRRVLEIGCGAGLLLFRIAPQCESYCATDFSSSAVAFIEQHSKRLGLQQVSTLHKMADDFSGFGNGQFDVVMLNSVVQYFPDATYLARVLEEASRVVRRGGYIFVGDVRSLPLLEVFHSSVELTRSSISTPLDRLRRSIRKRIAKEEECVIDPAFFAALPLSIPAITGVEVQLKRGHYENELTKFRYDVFLQTGNPTEVERYEPLAWGHPVSDVAALRRMLERQRPPRLCLTGIPNARLSSECKALEMLRHLEPGAAAADIRRVLDERDSAALYPESFWSLGQSLGYDVAVQWSGTGDPAAFDVALRQNDDARNGDTPAFRGLFPTECSPLRPLHQYTNNPLRGIKARELMRRIPQSLADQLPSYMIPSSFSILDRLPLNLAGKLDRRTLREVEVEEVARRNEFVAPRDSFELRLAQIWEEFLDVQRIGVKDSFFELGGHSLLAVRVIARMQKVFGRTLPLATLFEKPTVEELAAEMRLDLEPQDVSPLVALRRTGSGAPLFLVHPAGGGVLCYYELVRHLGADRPIHGLQFQGFDLEPGAFIPVEKMAREYVRAIRSAQPQGPYLLGGWSAGGVIAFEMARQLQAAGEQVPVVLVLDMRAPVDASRRGAAPASQQEALVSLSRKLELYTGRQFQLSPQDLAGLDDGQQLDFFVKRMKATNMLPEDVDSAWLRVFLEIYDNNVKSIRAYEPSTYSGNVLLFRGKDSLPEVAEQYPEIYQDPVLGWQSLCSQEVAVRQVPGNHLSMIAPPNVQVMAGVIREDLHAW